MAKKSIAKHKLLAEVSPEKSFFLKGGKRVSSLIELLDELKVMVDNIYDHHVNEKKNDFSSWIKEVIDDTDLAKKNLKS